MSADAPRGRAVAKLRRRVIILTIAIGALALLYYALKAFVTIDTNLLWFRSVHDEGVYTRTFWTRVVLFAIFGGLMAVFLAVNLIVFHRARPDVTFDPAKQRWRSRFRLVEPRLHRWAFVLIVGYYGVTMGTRASGSWQTWLLWRNAQPFGVKDPQFHRDDSYYLFVYPMHRLVLTLLFRIVATALIAVLVSAYAYGALRIRGRGPRMTRALRAQVSALIGIYFVLKALAYWLDRYALTTSNRGVATGPAYTDVKALLPAKFVLLVIAGICAAILFANAIRGGGRLLVGAVGLMAVSAGVVGVAWPAVVQQFREKPSASKIELPYIQHDIDGTLAAYGLGTSTVTTTTFEQTSNFHGDALAAQAASDAQIRLLDPNQLSPTFNNKQQIAAYYGFKSTLDIDRYALGGTTTTGSTNQDVAIAVRELNLSGLPSSRQTWTNTHLVYTHGYGVTAAPTNTMPDGLPGFLESGLTSASTGPLAVTQPRVYFGQMSPSYSIVGAPAGSTPKEFDRPNTNGSGQVNTTYTGGGGIPLGTVFHRLLYAAKLHSTSVLFSSEINKDSQLLTVRNPRARVAAVAPWLTLDGDTYPTVVDGHILWVVDGYTTSNSYPNSQQVNLRSATSSTLSQNGATVSQPSTSINYIRNSVKATVDAYTGKVTLYAWNQAADPDPILSTWEKAFPGLVQPQSDMPADLVAHLRYPQDLFNVQRTLLTKYHVTDASDFYNGNDFWAIPPDPTVSSSTRTNSLGKTVKVGAPSQASVYMTMSPDGSAPAEFALSSSMVTLNNHNLAAFVSVDSEPGPDYGKFTLLRLPPGETTESPLQIQNDIESNSKVSSILTLARGGNSKVVLGNQLVIPVAGQMLYVEPIYTQATGGSSFPILRHVAVIYGNGGNVAFQPTLQAALDEAFGVKAADQAAATTSGG